MSEIYIQHHGVKGMRWGVRRYQRKDGSLTSLGRRKLEGYRNDAMEKAKKRSERSKAYAKDTKNYINEIKSKGSNSERLKRDFDWLDNDHKLELANKRGMDNAAMLEALFNGGTIRQGTLNRLALDEFVNEKTSDLKSKYSREISAAKKYTEKYENLKAMDLDAKANTMDYKSIKRSIKNA